MSIKLEPARLLRIFLGEEDLDSDGCPLYEALLMRARDGGMAGATVLRGIAGFGSHSRLHSVKVLRLAEDLPVVIELVDTPERIDAFLSEAEDLLATTVITVENVQYAPRHHG